MAATSELIARVVYRLAGWLLLPFVFLYFYWRGRREPGYRQGWRQRLGYVRGLPRDAIWIHAASVGEVALAVPLVRGLVERDRQQPVIVTTFTPTGAERARAGFGDIAMYCYLPLDTVGATRRFMHRARPRLGVIMETELWPHLFDAASRADVPLVIANASISARSASRYQSRWLAPLMHFVMARVTAIGAANDMHAGRFIALGAREAQVCVTGNLKYDTELDDGLLERGTALRDHWQAAARPIWIAASTHAGEEAIVLGAFRKMLETREDALLVLAPRHPQRFDDVRRLLQNEDWRFVSHDAGTPVDGAVQVVLGDTLGDVPLFYAAANGAFVGGSPVSGIGGHNVLEAAALGRPIVVGPHIHEWQAIVDRLTEAGGAAVARDVDSLAATTLAWLQDDISARAAGEAARACVQAERGALAHTLALLDAANPRRPAVR